MDINEAIRTRRSIRRYKPDPVSRGVLAEIVETCRWAGSAMNTQPWEFAILGGEVMKELKNRLFEKLESRAPEELEFSNGMPLPELYSQRAAENRAASDGYHFPPGTESVEEKKRAHFMIGARVHEAPNAIIIYTDKHVLNWPWGLISMGIMVQTVCLAALAHGLGTCVMGGPVARPNVLRELLGIPQSKAILNAIAIGYPDFEARINNFPRPRVPLESWVHWHGF